MINFFYLCKTMDEIFEFNSDSTHGNIKFKKITTTSPETWQMYNPDFKKWVKVEYSTALSYFNLLIQKRQVLIEKKGNGTKK